MRLAGRPAIVAALATVAFEAGAEIPPGVEDQAIGQLQWLAGCWERRTANRIVEEQWMAPRAGTMLGMSRTIRDDTVLEYEQTRIHTLDGRLVFTAKPSGQAESSFTAVEVDSSRVVFENPAHDFPQRVIYARTDAGALLARIEGERDGKLVGVDFPMERVDCPGEPAR